MMNLGFGGDCDVTSFEVLTATGPISGNCFSLRIRGGCSPQISTSTSPPERLLPVQFVLLAQPSATYARCTSVGLRKLLCCKLQGWSPHGCALQVVCRGCDLQIVIVNVVVLVVIVSVILVRMVANVIIIIRVVLLIITL